MNNYGYTKTERKTDPERIAYTIDQATLLIYTDMYMKKKILNYVVVVEPDTRTGTNEPCYAAYCPALGLADSGDSIEEALANMQNLVLFHVHMLKKEREKIPVEQTDKSIVTTLRVAYPS